MVIGDRTDRESLLGMIYVTSCYQPPFILFYSSQLIRTWYTIHNGVACSIAAKPDRAKVMGVAPNNKRSY